MLAIPRYQVVNLMNRGHRNMNGIVSGLFRNDLSGKKHPRDSYYVVGQFQEWNSLEEINAPLSHLQIPLRAPVLNSLRANKIELMSMMIPPNLRQVLACGLDQSLSRPPGVETWNCGFYVGCCHRRC